MNVGIVACRSVGRISWGGAVYVPSERSWGRMFRGVEHEEVSMSRVRTMSRGERISAVTADAATATPMEARGLGESRAAAESATRVGSGRERMAESREEVHDSSVLVSIQWMKEAFWPGKIIRHMLEDFGDAYLSVSPRFPPGPTEP